ncbi:MAG: hypothetical protein HS101_07910 [Planctomycetia bacterium]|nr:hypothetical protein [Planctomycetia bacterium]
MRTVDDQVWTANKGSDNVSRLTNGGSYVNAIDMSPGFEGECHPVAPFRGFCRQGLGVVP